MLWGRYFFVYFINDEIENGEVIIMYVNIDSDC